MVCLRGKVVILACLGLIWANFVVASDFTSIHQIELEKHKDVEVEQGSEGVPAQNFTGVDLTTLLSSAANRNTLINNLLAEAQTTNADGINIDFENVPGAQKANLTTFMTDLTNTFKAVRGL